MPSASCGRCSAYSLAFAEGNAWIGGTTNALLEGVGIEAKGTIPHVLFMAYQGTFAIITAALISGADRRAHAVRAVPRVHRAVDARRLRAGRALGMGRGLALTRGVLDFAGGTVVHINAGVAALVAALVLGSRKDYGRQAILPHNVPFVLLGAGLLWFGWFGFNGGSALAANELAALAFTNTMLAPMATLVVWMLLDYFRTGRATAVGGATGIVIGLVAITPAAGFISPIEALAARRHRRVPELLRHRVAVAHAARRLARRVRRPRHRRHHRRAPDRRLRLEGLEPGRQRRPARRQPGQLGTQALGVASSIVYAALGTFVILKLLGLVTALRAAPRAEGLGMDVTQHGEEAYSNGEGSILVMPDASTVGAPVRALTPQTAAR